MPNTVPYISFVVAARNDNHGKNRVHRTNLYINVLAQQCQEFELPAELIFVEWNPPAGTVGIREAYNYKPALGTPLSIRVIEVPREVHNRYPLGQHLPLYQMIAKNVGIRRAEAPFVLATNPDILYSSHMIEFLAKRTLVDTCYYRAVRHDLSTRLLNQSGADLPGLFGICANNVARVQGRGGDTTLPFMNASGDFTLMATSKWFELRGYTEYDLWSMHIDSEFLFMAKAAGLHERILKYPVYHINHDNSWSTNASYSRQFPMLDLHKMMAEGKLMVQRGKPVILNDANWGLSSVVFSEYALHGSGRLECVIAAGEEEIGIRSIRPEGGDINLEGVLTPTVVQENARSEEEEARLIAKRQGISLFTSVKKCPEGSHVDVVQRNGIGSWGVLTPKPQVTVMRPHGMQMPGVVVDRMVEQNFKRDARGAPSLLQILGVGIAFSSHDIVGYVNSDIILFNDVLDAVSVVKEALGTFCMIGSRTDVGITSVIDFADEECESRLRRMALGQSAYVGGADFFLMTRDAWGKVLKGMPDFYLGRTAWDTWMIWRLLEEGVPVVNATHDVLAIHQRHKYNGDVDLTQLLTWPETLHNRNLAKGKERDVRHASWLLVDGEVVRHNCGL